MKKTLTVDRKGFSKFKVTHNGFNYHIIHDDTKSFVTMKGVIQLDCYMPAAVRQEIDRKLTERRAMPKVVDRFKQL